MKTKTHTALIKVLASQSEHLDPESTGLTPRLPKLSGMRALVFDIYGTLFISGSGDISLAEEVDRDSVLLSLLGEIGVSWPNSEMGVSDAFIGLIRASHERDRTKGVDYPEVEIREIWRELLRSAGADSVSEDTIEALALRYETRVNPVWPMPGLQAVLDELKARHLSLGIISNAQFYTPLLFEHFLGLPLTGLGFDESLCVWSYEERRGKPSQTLFDISVERLARHGLRPEEVLYVGNDMRNDIVPAASAGMRTALFAGDARSLRLREHPVDAIPADIVVTDLLQIIQCLA